MVDVYCEVRTRYISMTSLKMYACGNLLGVTFFVSTFLDYFVVNLRTFVALDKNVCQPRPLNSSLFELHQRQ